MAWTYSGNPAGSALDQVRALIGDTDQENPILSDEEILFFLSEEGSARRAAPRAALAAAAKFAKEADKAIGDLRISLSQKADKYLQLAAALEASAVKPGMPWSADQGDPVFYKGMMGG
ncbi:MAG: hypothetical protein H5U02_00620 [Clostridia bacterium]|nr:hypothetical protein [Clostridia bacterium]